MNAENNRQYDLDLIGKQVQLLRESVVNEVEVIEQSVLAQEIKIDDLSADYQETDRVIRVFFELINQRIAKLEARLQLLE
jgi:hypothetical protein